MSWILFKSYWDMMLSFIGSHCCILEYYLNGVLLYTFPAYMKAFGDVCVWLHCVLALQIFVFSIRLYLHSQQNYHLTKYFEFHWSMMINIKILYKLLYKNACVWYKIFCYWIPFNVAISFDLMRTIANFSGLLVLSWHLDELFYRSETPTLTSYITWYRTQGTRIITSCVGNWTWRTM